MCFILGFILSIGAIYYSVYVKSNSDSVNSNDCSSGVNSGVNYGVASACIILR
jgi:hypothetical protein